MADIISNQQQEKRARKPSGFDILVYRYFSFVAIVLFLAIIGAGYAYLLKPKYDFIVKKNEIDIENKKRNIEEVKKYISELEEFNDFYSNIGKENIDIVNRILPKKEREEEYFVFFNALAEKAKLQLNKVVVGGDTEGSKKGSSRVVIKGEQNETEEKERAESGAGKTNVTIELNGINYAKLKKLLQIIENNSRLMDVESLQFNLEGGVASMDITLYYL